MANLWDPAIVYDASMDAYWQDQTVLSDTTLVPLSDSLVTGSVMEVHFIRTTPGSLREDQAMFSLHWTVEAGPGAPMSRLDAADAARVEAAFSAAWMTTVLVNIANDWTLKEFAWRHFGADFPRDKNGMLKNGPVWRLQPVMSAGGNSGARLPDQVAITTTYRTASRKHWGRIYQGGFTIGALTDSQMGHVTTAQVDTIATASQVLFNDVYNDARKTWPVVWSPKYRGALTVNEVSVDDTFDIIRSRRAKFPSYRKTFTS